MAASLTLVFVASLASVTTPSCPAAAQEPGNGAQSSAHRDAADEPFNAGADLASQGRLQEAVAAYSKAIQLRPAFTNAYYNRGLCFESLKQWDKALADYTTVITQEPKRESGYVQRGDAYTQLRKYDEAVDDYQKALALNPADKKAAVALGTIYLGIGSTDQSAIKAFSQHISDPPKPSEKVWLASRAQAYVNGKDWTNAITD
jgi:tetratricopeptide (TPR) repeat protein